jgi:hypothetical protein
MAAVSCPRYHRVQSGSDFRWDVSARDHRRARLPNRKTHAAPRYIPPRDIFPADPWVFEAVRFNSKLVYEFAGQAETMFALSNGYLGMRGMIEERIPVKEPGVFLSRFRIAVARGFNSRSHASMVPYRWKGTLSLIP